MHFQPKEVETKIKIPQTLTQPIRLIASIMVYIKSEGKNIWCVVCPCSVKGFEPQKLSEIFFLPPFFFLVRRNFSVNRNSALLFSVAYILFCVLKAKPSFICLFFSEVVNNRRREREREREKKKIMKGYMVGKNEGPLPRQR